MNSLRFPELTHRGLRHFFTLRESGFSDSVGLPQRLQAEGLPSDLVTAEQVHGAAVAKVSGTDAGKMIPQTDALITRTTGLALIVRVADCGPVWLHCRKTGSIGLVHSGRKGTERGIVPAAIRKMMEEFGADPDQMLALLGPCIRPPHYEVDFAAEIRRQLRHEKVSEIVDCGLCTARDPARFYSYRRDKGKTGRHYAAVSLEKPETGVGRDRVGRT